MFLSDFDKGYIAGIIDGQGSICLTKQHSNEFRSPSIQVSSTTYEILQYLKNKIGGSISIKTKNHANYKDSWVWQIKTNLTLELLEQIQDYLLVPEKKFRAKLLVSEYKKVTPRNGKYSEQKLAEKVVFEEKFFNGL